MKNAREREVFVRIDGLCKTIGSIEARLSGEQVSSGGGRRCPRIGIFGGQGETRYCKILSPYNLRGRRTISVAVSVVDTKRGF